MVSLGTQVALVGATVPKSLEEILGSIVPVSEETVLGCFFSSSGWRPGFHEISPYTACQNVEGVYQIVDISRWKI